MKKFVNYDEAFKELMRDYFEPFAIVITDYELLDLPKRADILIIEEADKPLLEHVKMFTYFKRFNIIEFKSEKDRFSINTDLYNLGIYLNGVLLKEKEANYNNTTFSLVTTLRPEKFLEIFNAVILTDGLYRIDNIALIPIYIVVIEELEIDFEKEIECLKVFTSIKDRYNVLYKHIDNIKKDPEALSKIIRFLMSLYKNEFIDISKTKGVDMTFIEKNVLELTEIFGLKDKYYQEGEIEGKLEGKIEGKIEDVQNAISYGFSDEIISKITGLPIEQIIDIKKNMNLN